MDQLDLFHRLGVALALGLLIGTERSWQGRGREEGSRVAGVRTFGLIGIFGGLWGAIGIELTDDSQPGNDGLIGLSIMLGVVFAAFAGTTALFRLRAIGARQDYGATTLIAAYATFALGVLTVVGDMVAAAAAAVAITTLLSLKQPLHRWIAAFSEAEIMAALKLLVMTIVLLPILPNRDFGPWAALNPFELWLMVILIAGVSFVGYVAIKVTGERRGILLTGLAGGMVSSTATTIELARKARHALEHRRVLAVGIGLATLTMFVRVLVVVAIIDRSLLLPLSVPLGAASLGCALAALALWPWGAERHAIDRPMPTNPLDFGDALKFGGLLALILIATKAALIYFGTVGIYGLALVSGLADVDAATLSFARAANREIAPDIAVTAIILLVLSNSTAKTILALTIGGRQAGPLLAIPLFVALVVGLTVVLARMFWLA